MMMLSPIFQRRQWHPTPVLLPGKSHGQRSLVGCSPWGGKESDTTEWLHFHFSLSCIREGNGNPLQCSCLENLRDGGAWWTAIYGVTQSRTRLKRLSSSIIYSHTLFEFETAKWDDMQNIRLHFFYERQYGSVFNDHLIGRLLSNTSSFLIEAKENNFGVTKFQSLSLWSSVLHHVSED